MINPQQTINFKQSIPPKSIINENDNKNHGNGITCSVDPIFLQQKA